MNITKVRDLIAAEEALEQAEREYRSLNDNPAQWSAFESVSQEGRKVLNVLPGHLERRQTALDNIRAAEQNLLAVKRAFFAGVDHAAR